MFPKNGIRFHTMLFNCGHERVTSPQYSWDGMKRGARDQVIWQYTLAGQGALDFGGRTIPLVPGTGFLVIVPERHRYYLPPLSPSWEFLYVSLSGSESVRIAAECRRLAGGPVANYAPDSPVVQKAWTLLSDCREKRIDHSSRCSSAAYEFMMMLLDSVEQTTNGKAEILLNMIYDYCIQNISRPVSVEEAAARAGLSRWHFSRCFQKAYGKSFHDFIIELKMRMALRRLQSSRDSVKEIAQFCGFDDPAYFCKVFKRVYGETPGRFRDCSSAAR